MNERLLRMALAALPAVNVGVARHLLSRCSSLERLLTAPRRELAVELGCDPRFLADDIRQKALEKARLEERFIESNGIRVLWFDDPSTGYPPLLAEAEDAPVALFVLGNVDLSSKCSLSIVGTRHATAYGTEFTRQLVKELSEELSVKPLVVSGLAYGIDVAAHRAALEFGAPTAAVLAHGLRTLYPAAHRDVARRIIEGGGALVTEYFSDTTAHRANFLARNRIVAALAQATVVVESDLRGGSLSTARLAAEYHRDVFALPGRVTDRFSRGCIALIERHAAQILTCASALADEMNWQRIHKEEAVQQSLFDNLQPLEQSIVDMLRYHGEMRMAQLQAGIDAPAHMIMGTLVDLEFRGIVASLPGARYRMVN